ncbi:MAG: DUF421 domain-containing protein [Clostridia bacterium]|nr:DUF421 domain-containing protein [Clostridia bacterium]
MGIAFVRTVILYITVVAAVRVMGKRQIGELQPSELVVAILISELAAIPMQEPGIPLTSGIVPILTLISCEIILSAVTVMSIRARRFITGKPVVLIENGHILQHEMRRLRYTIDDLLEELRLAGYMSVDEVAWAIIETNGKVSFFPAAANKPATAGMLNLTAQDGGPPVTVISDGVILSHGLSRLGRDINWLHGCLQPMSLQPAQVFLMTADSQGKILVVPKEKKEGAA